MLADMSLVQKNPSRIRKQTNKAAKRPEWDVRFSYISSICLYYYQREIKILLTLETQYENGIKTQVQKDSPIISGAVLSDTCVTVIFLCCSQLSVTYQNTGLLQKRW